MPCLQLFSCSSSSSCSYRSSAPQLVHGVCGVWCILGLCCVTHLPAPRSRSVTCTMCVPNWVFAITSSPNATLGLKTTCAAGGSKASREGIASHGLAGGGSAVCGNWGARHTSSNCGTIMPGLKLPRSPPRAAEGQVEYWRAASAKLS